MDNVNYDRDGKELVMEVSDVVTPEGISRSGAPNLRVEKAYREILNMAMRDDADMKDYQDIDEIYEDGLVYIYSIKLGGFNYWERNGSYSLEHEYPTMQAMVKDMLEFSLAENFGGDFFYSPYIEVVIKIDESTRRS